MNTAIIVAAGEGKRFGGGRPKQFVEILGKPVIIHTLERFQASPVIDEIIAVAADRELLELSRAAEEFGIDKLVSTVAGGDSRTESVLNGLSVVRPEANDIVAIHDGARPVVPQEDIRRVIAEAQRTGAACLVAEITDTVKVVREGRIESTLDRRVLRRALTPQCFRYEVIRYAFGMLEQGAFITDDSSLVEASGGTVSVVEGSALNIKITFEHDLLTAETNLTSLFEMEFDGGLARPAR